jgi:hypothetical protein
MNRIIMSWAISGIAGREWQVRYGLRPAGRTAGGKSRERRTRLADVLWPLAVGLALGALTLWVGLTYSHNQAAFRAQARPATGVIDQIYASSSTVGYNGVASFDQYGVVRFEAHGQFADARVLLGSCTGPCTPRYHVGQEVLVYYGPQNLSYAQLGAPGHGTPLSFFGIWLFGILAVIFLFAAVVNAVTWIRG